MGASKMIMRREPAGYPELVQFLARRVDEVEPAGIAVDALVFDRGGRWLLHRRGAGCRDEVGRLEGLGGRLEPGEHPREAVVREIREEAGDDIEVEIERFIGGRVVHPRGGGTDERPWIVISYLCRLRSGEPVVTESNKNAGFVRVNPADVDPRDLSASAYAGWRWLRSPSASAQPKARPRALGASPGAFEPTDVAAASRRI